MKRTLSNPMFDPLSPYRDWKTYRITRVDLTNEADMRLDLVTNEPSMYPNFINARFEDFLRLASDDRLAVTLNTDGDALDNLVTAEERYANRQQRRVKDALIADNRNMYRRALAPESFLLYNDAREELDQLHRSMRRKDVPKRVTIVDGQGNETETQQVTWVRLEIKRLQELQPTLQIAQLEKQLYVTEQRLVQDWNRIIELARMVSTSEWIRDTMPWGALYNPRNNREIEDLLYNMLVEYPDTLENTTFGPPHPKSRKEAYKIMH